ncbi:hypothetical protein [Alcanivorax nanhaiticus]|uniref:hypothetical protein n=1 Tax=Alcanivorax nanhaiticus TaxID=1177154 RepID=UPI0012E0B39A|nr:hypothetical protein [Alcanivorax nanhaiticus]
MSREPRVNAESTAGRLGNPELDWSLKIIIFGRLAALAGKLPGLFGLILSVLLAAESS